MKRLAFVLLLSTGTMAKKYRFTMPGAEVTNDDEYLSTQFAVPEPEVIKYIHEIEIEYDEKVHHVLVYGCANEARSQIVPTAAAVCSQKKILFAWALKANALDLPEGAAIPIGGHSGIRSIQLECHYKDRFDGADSVTGVAFEANEIQPAKLVGIFLLGAMSINLTPNTWTNVNVGCRYNWDDEIDVFAYRTHAHGNGRVITGYRKRGEKFTMIGKGNPLWPHAFYTRVGGPISLRGGDEVFATCRYFNEHEGMIGVGQGRTDEMCNLYLMYATPFRDEPLKAMSCWGYRVEDVESDYLNQLDVNDLTPYPGYAGAVSEKAINSGKWAMPLVPDEMVGGMGHHDHAHNMADMGHDMEEHDDDHDHMEGHDEHEMVDEDSGDTVERVEAVEIENEVETRSISFSKVTFAADWEVDVKLGEVAGVDTDGDGSIWVFHRADRTWNGRTFIGDDIQNRDPIRDDVVMHFDASGKLLNSWGGNGEFLLPHGITVTAEHVWLTDVGTHQIYKYSKNGTLLFARGTYLKHGTSETTFCKPADVYVDAEADIVYVADGYCNTRLVRLSAQNGDFIDSIEDASMLVVHDISQGPGDQIFVADREHGILKVFDKAEQAFVDQISNEKQIGNQVFASVYSPHDANIYLVNGAGATQGTSGLALALNKTILDDFVPGEFKFETPHDISLSHDGRCLYVAQLRPHNVFKFHVEGDPILHSIFDDFTLDQAELFIAERPRTSVGILSTLIFVVFGAALIARGCRRKRAPTKTYVYKPLLTNEIESDDEDVEIYNKRITA